MRLVVVSAPAGWEKTCLLRDWSLDDLATILADRPTAVGQSTADRGHLWAYRERHREAAGFLGITIKLYVSVPSARWVHLATSVAGVVADVDSRAKVITYGHVADGNVNVNVVPAAAADGRHETPCSHSSRPWAAQSPPSTASAP